MTASTGLWRNLACLTAVAAAIWFAGLFSGLSMGFPETAASEQRPVALPSWGGIFCVNIRVVAACLLGVFSFSLASIVTLFLNGMLTGLQWEAFAAYTSGWQLVKVLAPHGAPELMGFFLAGAAGLLGVPLSRAVLRSDNVRVHHYLHMLLGLAAAATLLTMAAAIVESYCLGRLR